MKRAKVRKRERERERESYNEERLKRREKFLGF